MVSSASPEESNHPGIPLGAARGSGRLIDTADLPPRLCQGLSITATLFQPVFISRSRVTNSCGRRYLDGTLYPMNCATSPVKALQLYTDACQTGELACSLRMYAVTLLYSVSSSIT